jgi:xanthine dehydrogenase YagS FAD-binding subunit
LNRFQHLRARSVDEALEALDRHPRESRVIAGGQDLLFRIKKQIVAPDYLVSVRGIRELTGIEATNGHNGSQQHGGARIGASQTLSAIARHPSILAQYATVAEAAREVASPQIRNAGTAGGNLLQDVWCWYLQSGFDCWKAGGKKCDLVRGDTRYYGSVFLGHQCLANHPSDLAPALLACDAEVEIASTAGRRRMGIAELLPGHTMVDGVLQAHTLRSNEVLTSIWLPLPPAGSRSTFAKFALRGSWDFAIAAAAVRLGVQDGVCTDARIVLGGVATMPYRRTDAEAVLVGQRLTPELAAEAAARAVSGAYPIRNNAYKVDVARTLVKRAILRLAA